ncbi:hypothetical protein MUP79_04230 [Candidatus Bathyarchaeota archaeon]|nr:hypothetical protein [Candidatus Bathyarchaeota archaeon]
MENSDAKRATSTCVPSFSKYPILVGTFAFGASQPVIEESVKLLNSAETRIRFKNLSRVPEYPHKNALGVTFMDSDSLLEICTSILKQHPECQFMIGIYPFRVLEGRKDAKSVTASDLENDLFTIENDARTCSIISLRDLDVFAVRAARSLRVALAALMLSEIASLLYHYDPETEHRVSEACLLDYCDTKEEIIPSLISLGFCGKCEERVLTADLGKDLLRLASWLRSPPWYQDQPVVFWGSIPMLTLGIGLLLLGSLFPNSALSEDFKLLSSILIPLGGFFLGLSRTMKKT